MLKVLAICFVLSWIQRRGFCQSWCDRTGSRFYCSGDPICLPSAKVCNGNRDCPGGEDERNCGKTRWRYWSSRIRSRDLECRMPPPEVEQSSSYYVRRVRTDGSGGYDRIRKPPYKFGDVVVYVCNRGRRREGPGPQCHLRGAWSEERPKCVVPCRTDERDPEIIANFDLQCGQQCDVTSECPNGMECYCDVGCARVCVDPDVNCGDAPDVSGAHLSYTGSGIRKVARYKCQDGYYLHSGHLSIRCSGSGIWTGDIPDCRQHETTLTTTTTVPSTTTTSTHAETTTTPPRSDNTPTPTATIHTSTTSESTSSTPVPSTTPKTSTTTPIVPPIIPTTTTSAPTTQSTSTNSTQNTTSTSLPLASNTHTTISMMIHQPPQQPHTPALHQKGPAQHQYQAPPQKPVQRTQQPRQLFLPLPVHQQHRAQLQIQKNSTTTTTVPPIIPTTTTSAPATQSTSTNSLQSTTITSLPLASNTHTIIFMSTSPTTASKLKPPATSEVIIPPLVSVEDDSGTTIAKEDPDVTTPGPTKEPTGSRTVIPVLECNHSTTFVCNDGVCISKTKVCNKNPDCLRGEDEENCPESATEDEATSTTTTVSSTTTTSTHAETTTTPPRSDDTPTPTTTIHTSTTSESTSSTPVPSTNPNTSTTTTTVPSIIPTTTTSAPTTQSTSTNSTQNTTSTSLPLASNTHTTISMMTHQPPQQPYTPALHQKVSAQHQYQAPPQKPVQRPQQSRQSFLPRLLVHQPHKAQLQIQITSTTTTTVPPTIPTTTTSAPTTQTTSTNSPQSKTSTSLPLASNTHTTISMSTSPTTASKLKPLATSEVMVLPLVSVEDDSGTTIAEDHDVTTPGRTKEPTGSRTVISGARNNFPTYRHPEHSTRICYKCPPGFYKDKDCRATRHKTQHPQWPTCSPCPESQFSHGWNTDEQCWDYVSRNETFVRSQVEMHPGKTAGPKTCGCPGASIEDETGNCVDAITMKENLAIIKEIERNHTEWLPSWAAGLIGLGLGLLIALGIFFIYQGCEKCKRMEGIPYQERHIVPSAIARRDDESRPCSEDGHVHCGVLDSRFDIVDNINEERQDDPRHRSLPILPSCNTDPVESTRIPATGHFEHRFATGALSRINPDGKLLDDAVRVIERRVIGITEADFILRHVLALTAEDCERIEDSCDAKPPSVMIRAGFKEWREKNSKEATVEKLLVSLQIHMRKALAEEVASSLGLPVQQGSEMPEDDDFDKLITICETSINPERAKEFFRVGLQLDNDITDALFQESRSTFVRKGLLEWRNQRGADATPDKLVHLLREGGMEAVADEICRKIDLGEPDLRAGQSGSRTPVPTGENIDQAQTRDASSTFRQDVGVEIPTSDAQQEASPILGSDESTKPMAVYGTNAAINSEIETPRQKRTLEAEYERVKQQDGSVECLHINLENEAPDHDGKADPTREICGSSTSLKYIEECSDIVFMTEGKIEAGDCEVFESSNTSESSDVMPSKPTNHVTSGHETELSIGIGSPFRTGEIYSNESKSEYKPGAMAQAFLKQTFGNFFKSLRKDERVLGESS